MASIQPLPSIRLSIGAHIAAILASLWTADPDRVLAALDPVVIAFLRAIGSVVPPVLAVLHSWRLGKTEERTGHDCDG